MTQSLLQALKYVSFPVQTLAKCAKMIPVMVSQLWIFFKMVVTACIYLKFFQWAKCFYAKMITLFVWLPMLVDLLVIYMTFYLFMDLYVYKWRTACCGCFRLCFQIVLFLYNDWKVESFCSSIFIIFFESLDLEIG